MIKDKQIIREMYAKMCDILNSFKSLQIKGNLYNDTYCKHL